MFMQLNIYHKVTIIILSIEKYFNLFCMEIICVVVSTWTTHYLFSTGALCSRVFSLASFHLGMIRCWRLGKEEGISNMPSSNWLEGHRLTNIPCLRKIIKELRSKYLELLLDVTADLWLTDKMNFSSKKIKT